MIKNQKRENFYFKKYNGRILKFLKKYKRYYDYDEINQFRNDIFIKLYNNFDKLPKKDNEINKYIYITCKNYIIDYKRTNSKYLEYNEDDEFFENIEGINNIEYDYIIPEHYNTKFKTLGDIKYNILDYKTKGYSITEISKIMNMPRSNIYKTFKILKENENI
jgi:RNA polymerase sigma factor (sigma-70 family)